jgi:hypothetical protein
MVDASLSPRRRGCASHHEPPTSSLGWVWCDLSRADWSSATLAAEGSHTALFAQLVAPIDKSTLRETQIDVYLCF